jgi:hypothetical protein
MAVMTAKILLLLVLAFAVVEGFLPAGRRGVAVQLHANNNKQSSSESEAAPSSSTPKASKPKYLKTLVASVLASAIFLESTTLAPSPSVAATITTVGLEAAINTFETAETREETVQAFADLFEAAGQKTLLTRTKYKSRIINAINTKRVKLNSQWDQALGYESGELKRRVDPYRTVDLKGFLQVSCSGS